MQVTFSPDDEGLPHFRREQRRIENHLSPGVRGLLEHDELGVPLVALDLLAAANPAKASLGHVAKIASQRLAQPDPAEQQGEIVRGEDLRLFDDHAIAGHVPSLGFISVRPLDAQRRKRIGRLLAIARAVENVVSPRSLAGDRPSKA